jgi:hypothetical protein
MTESLTAGGGKLHFLPLKDRENGWNGSLIAYKRIKERLKKTTKNTLASFLSELRARA